MNGFISYLVACPHAEFPILIRKDHDKGILIRNPEETPQIEAVRHEDGKVRTLSGQQVHMYNWSWKYK
jgi:hypothetical protein